LTLSGPGSWWPICGANSFKTISRSRGPPTANRSRRNPQRNPLPQHSVANVYTANNGWVLGRRMLIGVRAMRCMTCGAEMILVNVAQDDTMADPGFEHHTFMCSECHVTERRVVFMRHGREDDAEPMPIHAAPSIVPASTVQDAHIAPQGLFGRVVARIRGAARATFSTQ
jgi:hypothetical protein